MYPQLVEPTIVDVMNYQLLECNKKKVLKNTIIFNVTAGIIILIILGMILYIKYKGKQDIQTTIKKENRKRDYILSKLQFYQKQQTKEFTNMPI
jgi:hypothetical protein